MATIKEIAKACHVSVATVSNILNNKGRVGEETRRLVLDKVKELNYTPNLVARNLKTKRSRSIGVIAEDMTIFSIPNIMDGITARCQEENYQVLFSNLRLFQKYNDTYYNRDDYYGLVREEIGSLLSKQAEGIIYVAAHERVLHCIPEDLPIPAVMAYGYTESAKVPSVVVDDEDGAYQIMQYLISMGHRRIGVITGKTDSIHMQQRLHGYQRALYENQILYDPALVRTGDWYRESGRSCGKMLLDLGVTAIFCMNDLMAGGVYDVLGERGLSAGREISVVGYDNREVSRYYQPPLSTVAIPLYEIGYQASELIMEMLQPARREKRNDGAGARVYGVKCDTQLRQSVRNISAS